MGLSDSWVPPPTHTHTCPHQCIPVALWSRVVFFFLHHACVLSGFSRVRLCDPRDRSPPGSSVQRILQNTGVAMPSSRGSSWPRDLQWQNWKIKISWLHPGSAFSYAVDHLSGYFSPKITLPLGINFFWAGIFTFLWTSQYSPWRANWKSSNKSLGSIFSWVLFNGHDRRHKYLSQIYINIHVYFIGT